MANVSGFVYYDPTRTGIIGTGLKNIPVALYNTGTGTGVVALTNALGAYLFTNVPAGNYEIIETWGTPGVATPVSFLTAAPMVAPPEIEPPLSVVTVPVPPLADALDAITPNMIKITVVLLDFLLQNFYDGPVGNKAITFTGVTKIGSNLITAASNGTWGSFAGGTPVMTTNPVDPYPGVSPGFTYSTSTGPADGFFTVMNTRSTSVPWWAVSDHTSKVETGRFMLVNGFNPGSIIFTQPVAVTPNTDYALTAWILNLIKTGPGPAEPQLALRVLDSNNNVLFFQMVNPIASTILLPVWYQNGVLFNTAGNSNITVQLISEGPAAVGNDYLIDDVELFQVNNQNLLTIKKSATPPVIFAGTDVTFTVVVKNNSSTETLNNVIFQDILDPTLVFVPGSVTVDAIPNGAANPNAGFSLGNMLPGTSHTIVFHAISTAGPSPVKNFATGTYPVLVDGNGNIITKTITSNTVFLRRPRNNFSRPSTDLATSVALEQTALSHILNAEGEKIQAALAIPGITPAELLCINESVASMIKSISNLEIVLEEKLEIVKCQLVGFQNCPCEEGSLCQCQ